jgi:hypothetical protein
LRSPCAEWDGQAAGYAFFFDCYSSFEGRIIFLEKIFSFARNFEGKTARLTPIAFENDYHGVVFNVLGWNKPAIGFYLKLGLNSGANGRPLVCVDVHLKQSQLRCTESTDSNARPEI